MCGKQYEEKESIYTKSQAPFKQQIHAIAMTKLVGWEGNKGEEKISYPTPPTHPISSYFPMMDYKSQTTHCS